MTATTTSAGVPTRAAALSPAVDQLAAISLLGLADDDLLDVLRLAERVRRQLEALDHLLNAEAKSRNLSRPVRAARIEAVAAMPDDDQQTRRT